MKIWVDGQCFQTGSNTRGIGRYVIDFLQALSAHNVELVVSLNGSMKQETVAARSYIGKFVPNAKVEIWYGTASCGEVESAYCIERMLDEKILAGHINDIKPDIALSASPFEGTGDQSSPFIKVSELNANIKTACIFYDAIPYRYPEVYLQQENVNKLYYRRLAEIPTFDLTLCISQFTENEYKDIFGKSNSVAIFAGLSNEIQALIADWVYKDNSIGAQLGSYVAYVGGIDWRKNVPYLVRSMAQLPECKTGELKLVLVGAFGDEHIQPLKDIFNEHNIPASCLVTTGYISDKELIDIYKNAVASVQPSIMEGFGLGALEAMACGTPFFSAFGGAVGEVVENKAQMFDPDVDFSLTHLLQKLLSDEKFKRKIIKNGHQRLKKFSWEQTTKLAMKQFDGFLIKNTASLRESNGATETSPRLIMDVTSTALSPVMSGIQRVMHNLSRAVLKQNRTESTETVLSFSMNTKDWYRLASLDKSSVKLSPQNRMNYSDNDTYLLLDSSWTFIEGQQQRLTDILVTGQEVVHGVYDLGPLTMSAMTSEGMPPVFRRWLEFILGYSTGIVCISKAVADEMYELIQDIKLPRPMKIGYFRLGADFSDVAPDSNELEFTKTRPIFLMVGTIEPRKGQYYGLKAFEKLWAQGVDVNLVIIGKAGWDTKVFQAVLDNHPEKNKRLFWRQGISDAGLAAAYEVADALVMTSYLEGFGLPVVEAGCKNTPVIMSDLPVFREVGEGTPKACYFTPGSVSDLAKTVADFVNDDLNVDYANVEVDWPTWDESAKELKEVVLNGNWYKHYKPEHIQPNIGFNDIGHVVVDRDLNSHEIQHELRIVEGPFISDDGGNIRVVVGVKNLSDVLWSSNHGQVGGVSLSYHLYDKEGNCVSYDNARTQIPFVLAPGKEILMPIRVDSEWLVKGVCIVGIELLQEGVRWFENEQKVSLLKPVVEQIIALPSNETVTQDKLQIVYLRGPFGKNLSVEQYFIFAVINTSTNDIVYTDSNSHFSYSFINNEDENIESGVWSVNHFDSVEVNNVGYLAVYADTNHVNKSKFISINYDNNIWLFNLETREITKQNQMIQAPKVFEKTYTVESTKTFDENRFAWLNKIDLSPTNEVKIEVDFNDLNGVSLRGFNETEDSHVWMSDLSGEIGLSALITKDTYISQIKITCSPFVKNVEPIELSLFIDNELIEKKIISHDFMEYRFKLSQADFIKFADNKFRASFVTNHNALEDNGERILSLCLSHLSLTSHNRKVKTKLKNKLFRKFSFRK